MVGIALNKVVAPVLQRFVKQEMENHYLNLDKYCSGLTTPCTLKTLTHNQVFAEPGLKCLKFENVNNNLQSHGKNKINYNYNITSSADLAKLFLPVHHTGFSSFDESLDLTDILRLLAHNNPEPIFPSPDPLISIQPAAREVRNFKNKFSHYVATDWTEVFFNNCFLKLDTLVKSLELTGNMEKVTLYHLSDWQSKGNYNYHYTQILLH